MVKNVLAQELIGCNIEIVDATNRSLVGIKGPVVDETMNTLVIDQGGRRKVLLKGHITFTTKIKDKRIKIDGKKVIGKPEKRQ